MPKHRPYAYPDERPMPSNCWFIAKDDDSYLIRRRDDASTLGVIEIKVASGIDTGLTDAAALRLAKATVRYLRGPESPLSGAPLTEGAKAGPWSIAPEDRDDPMPFIYRHGVFVAVLVLSRCLKPTSIRRLARWMLRYIIRHSHA